MVCLNMNSFLVLVIFFSSPLTSRLFNVAPAAGGIAAAAKIYGAPIVPAAKPKPKVAMRVEEPPVSRQGERERESVRVRVRVRVRGRV